jgi:hypothetical protein
MFGYQKCKDALRHAVFQTKEGQKMTSFIRFWNCSSDVEHDQVKI